MRTLIFALLMGLSLTVFGGYPDPVRITVKDRHGKVVIDRTYNKGNNMRVAFLLDGQPPGLYYMRIHRDDGYKLIRVRVR